MLPHSEGRVRSFHVTDCNDTACAWGCPIRITDEGRCLDCLEMRCKPDCRCTDCERAEREAEQADWEKRSDREADIRADLAERGLLDD